MRKSFLSLVIALTTAATLAQAQTNYNDVLVVINTNSPVSDSIGTYFAQARNIPAVNVARIGVSANEEIDTVQFNDLRAQLENYIIAHNLQNQVNYIVTTKGTPLKVNRGNTFSTTSPSSSVESELTLILGQYSNQIGGNGFTTSPYYYQNASFSRATYGIYLVTRLDGYSFDDVKQLIDRSGPNTYMSPMSEFVFDQDPDWNSSLPGLNNYMSTARNRLTTKGLVATLNQDTVYMTEKEQVAGYASWGSNDHYADHFTQYARPRNLWAPGAIAETYVSTSGRTFSLPASYGQSLIADLVAEGISGAKGYVYEPYSSAMAIVWILFDRYTSNYNLAESYYMASRALSWMDIIVGDPKTTVTFSLPLPITLGYFNGEVVGSTVELSWMTVSEINNYGFEVERRHEDSTSYEVLPNSFIPGYGTTLEPQFYSFTDAVPPSGTVYYRLKQIDLDATIHYHGPIEVLVNNGVMSTGQEGFTANAFRLEQSYPNPFNPSTEIRFSLPTAGRATLKVYNSIGQEVSTLIDGELREGSHSVQFNAKNLPSGMYLYRLVTNETVATHKMMLTK